MRAFSLTSLLLATPALSESISFTSGSIKLQDGCKFSLDSCAESLIMTSSDAIKLCLDFIQVSDGASPCTEATVSLQYQIDVAAECKTSSRRLLAAKAGEGTPSIQLPLADIRKAVGDIGTVKALQFNNATLGYKLEDQKQCQSPTSSTVKGSNICTGTRTPVTSTLTIGDVGKNISLAVAANSKLDLASIDGLLAAWSTPSSASGKCALQSVPDAQSINLTAQFTITPDLHPISNAKVELNGECVIAVCNAIGTSKQVEACLDEAAEKAACTTARYTRTIKPADASICRKSGDAQRVFIDVKERLSGEEKILARASATAITDVYFPKTPNTKCGAASVYLVDDCGTDLITPLSMTKDTQKLEFTGRQPWSEGTGSDLILVAFADKTTACVLSKDLNGDLLVVESNFTFTHAPSGVWTRVSLSLLTAIIALSQL